MKGHNGLPRSLLCPKTKHSKHDGKNDEDNDDRMVPGILVATHFEEEDEERYGADEETETEAVEVFEGRPGGVLTVLGTFCYEHWAEV